MVLPNFSAIFFTRERTLSSTILVAFRHVKWEKASLPLDVLPVDVRRSKTSLLKLPNIDHFSLIPSNSPRSLSDS